MNFDLLKYLSSLNNLPPPLQLEDETVLELTMVFWFM